MNEKPARKPRYLMWALCLGVPVVYLLSVPWVMIGGIKLGQDDSQLFRCYRKPYSWLISNTPLKQPLFNYSVWCGYCTINWIREL